MNLPNLVLSEILSYFTTEEKFKLRFVCKLWKELIEYEAKYQVKLLVYSGLNRYFKRRYYSPYQLYTSKNRVNQQFFDHFCLKGNYFPNVKSLILFEINSNKILENKSLPGLRNFLVNQEELFIYSYRGKNLSDKYFLYDFLDIKNLNFKRLKICNFENISLETDFNLNAPNLKHLTFWDQFSSDQTISFNCDQLKTLKCQYSKYFNQKFMNLENLICQSIDMDFDLLNYPKLKKLDFCPNYREMPFIEKLFNQKKMHKFDDLEIVAYGFKFSEFNENFKELLDIPGRDLCYIDFEDNRKSKQFFKFIVNNQLNLSMDYLSWPFSFDLRFSVYNKFVSSYLSRINLKLLTIRNVKGRKSFKNLINFLVEIGGIQNLNLYNCKIMKEDKFLFKKLPFINVLKLHKCDIEEGNFDFLTEINYLHRLEIGNIFYPINDLFNIFRDYKLQFLEISYEDGKDEYFNIEIFYALPKFIRTLILIHTPYSIQEPIVDNFDKALIFLKSNPLTKKYLIFK